MGKPGKIREYGPITTLQNLDVLEKHGSSHMASLCQTGSQVNINLFLLFTEAVSAASTISLPSYSKYPILSFHLDLCLPNILTNSKVTHLLINIPLKSPGSKVNDYPLFEEKHLIKITLFKCKREMVIITNP